MKKSHFKRMLPFSLLISLLILPATVLAEDPPQKETAAPVIEISNAYTIGAGYRYLDTTGGGETLEPYSNLDSNILGLMDFSLYFPWQGVIDFSADYSGESYYQIDGNFNYRSDVHFDVYSTEYPRNFEHLALPPSDWPGGSYNPEDLNPDDRYLLDIGEDRANLKIRMPNYPAHIRLGVRDFNVEGEKQQIFVDYNCATSCHNISETRKIDTRTTEVDFGADAHLGYIDTSYTFRNIRFRDNEPDPVWKYGILFGRRNPGLLEHNTFPDTISRDHQFTVSTSNTGRLAATAGYGLGERENEDSGLKQDYSIGSGNLVWRPLAKLCFTLKYNHFKAENASPDETITGLRNAGHLPLNFVNTKDSYSGSVCYNPFKILMLDGSVIRKELKRDDAEGFELPDKTITDTWKLGARLKPRRNISLKVYYQNEQVDDPAYDNTLTDRNDINISLDWQPWISTMLHSSFRLTRGNNDLETDRDEERQKFHAGITFAFEQPVTAGLYYTLFNDDVTSDLMVAPDDPVLFSAPDTAYEATGDQLLLQAGWRPLDGLEVEGRFSYLRAEGLLNIKTANFSDIGDYSNFDSTKKEFSLGLDYTLSSGWGLAAQCAYLTYDDQNFPENDEIIREIMTTVSKRW